MSFIDLPTGEMLNPAAVYSIKAVVVQGDPPMLAQGWLTRDEVQLKLHGEVRAVATSVAGAELVLVRVPVTIETTAVISDCSLRDKPGHVRDCITAAWRGPEVELAIIQAKAMARELLEGAA